MEQTYSSFFFCKIFRSINIQQQDQTVIRDNVSKAIAYHSRINKILYVWRSVSAHYIKLTVISPFITTKYFYHLIADPIYFSFEGKKISFSSTARTLKISSQET